MLDELHGKFVDLVWLILAQTSLINEALLAYLLAQVSTCAHDVAKSRRTLEPALQVTGTAKIPAGMTDFITPGAATITHAAHGRWSESRGLPSQCQNPESAKLLQSENSIERLQGKTPGEPEKSSYQKWLTNLFLKSIHHQ